MALKIGIIGLGDGGTCNLKSWKLVGADIVAICDLDSTRRNAAKVEAGIIAKVYEKTEDLCADSEVQLIVVATPDNKHLTVAKDALVSGKYVFIEKPVATELSDLVSFRDLVEAYPSKLLFSEKYSFAYPVQAALSRKKELGKFMTGSTSYTMWNCDRIMGDGKWRTEHAYNPCAGGLSHNFMTILLFVDSPIARVRANGQVLTYHENLDKFGGYDTMEGTLEFQTGTRLSWTICLAVQGPNSPFAHRTIAHNVQFERGALVYGPTPESDKLIVGGKTVDFQPEPQLIDPANSTRNLWAEYNIGVLYKQMHEDNLVGLAGKKTLHNITHGINVAAACAGAFQSAKNDGAWQDISSALMF